MGELTRELVELIRNPRALEEGLRRRVIKALQSPEEPHDITYDEFLDWADEDKYAEWVDGEIIVTTPASMKHQEISLFLGHLLDLLVRQKDYGKVIIAPFQMRLEHSGREPDLIFISKENLGRLKDTYLDGPADLVVEIASPESMVPDRGEKFAEYEQARIPEYWLIDPEREQADFYQLDGQGRYRSVRPDAQGAYHSKAIRDLWIRVDWLWEIPPVLDALRALSIIP
jgi:Uma2 family endonuclease